MVFSSDVVQREEEKKKLEKSYHESDRRLDNMVTGDTRLLFCFSLSNMMVDSQKGLLWSYVVKLVKQ